MRYARVACSWIIIRLLEDVRHSGVLATKVHEPMSDDIKGRGLSVRHIQMACDASLQRLALSILTSIKCIISNAWHP